MLTQIQVIIEIVLSLFLLMGIVYSFYLSRILSNLKHDRASLIGLVDKLEASVKSAEEGVEKLRIAGEVSGRPLSRIIELARITGTELDTVVDKADAMAHRLESLTMKALPHERKLQRLLEEAEEVGIEATPHTASPELPAEPTTMETPPIDPTAHTEPQQPDVAPSLADARETEKPTPADHSAGGEPLAWAPDKKEAIAPPAARKRQPPDAKAPPTGQNQPKDSSNQILLSDGQKSRRLKRLEKTFLGR
ncbi:DUF6468 domain-containing protein [Gluconacetobacter takamatsuzukensis]|uniref:DUF6468 domain-containing protein n=1 Tax=Gluconacetobacter takamatsuzukensis TaxID=1286190 RepID=A0A7W4PR75_9PROT|nr:DUF6468 domain-containing protein [Gluconacetobacter takamatsuzukensis]MBB2203591.1 hypothetical protein [Gluconacetobacter takamatsuzukensis]